MKYVILTLLLIGCATEPEVKYVIQYIEVPHENITIEINLRIQDIMYPEWKDYERGIFIWFMAHNLDKEKTWHGKPFVRIYSTRETIIPEDGFKDEDLIGEDYGVLCKEVINLMPKDITDSIMPNEVINALVFTPFSNSDIIRYYYILFGLEEDD